MTSTRPRRLLVTGAAGSGTTTLAGVLASRWSVPHADADDYFWVPTDPPYREVREPEGRAHLMRELFLPRPAWVLSGSVMGWGVAGEQVMDRVEAVVLLTVDPAVRLPRVEDRQRRRYGSAAISPGGELHGDHVDFLAWCAGYDDPAFEGRSLARHLEWLDTIEQPSRRLDGTTPVEELVAQVEDLLAGIPS